MQAQGVSSTAKHFMGNNSEFDRHNTDSIIDERTMREIYLPAFEACVKEAHVGAVMDSYNFTNGIHMTQNAHLNIEILKKEWGFTGILMSDWTSTYDAVGVANGGMDLEMPKGVFLNRETLLPAIKQGQVTVATIDDKVRRILRVAIQFGWLDRNQTDLSIPRYNREGDQVTLRAAQEGIVLLKNDGNLLPLKKNAIKSVLVVGPDAYPGSSGRRRQRPRSAIRSRKCAARPKRLSRKFSQGLLQPRPVDAERNGRSHLVLHSRIRRNRRTKSGTFRRRRFAGRSDPDAALSRTSISHRHPKKFCPIKRSPPAGPAITPRPPPANIDFFVSSTGEDGGYYRLYVDDKLILDDWTTSRELLGVATLTLDATAHKVVVEHHGHSDWLGGHFRVGIVREGTYVLADAKAMAATSDVVVVAAGFDPESESEGADRTFRLPPGQDELIKRNDRANKNTIVLISAGGSVDTNEWIDQVPALVQAWYPGQEGGRAIAEIFFGEINPSGRLPITIERRWEDNPVHDTYYPQAGTNRVIYKEGVFVGYRGYEKNNTKPLFPFGYGLSYTTFKYANLAAKPADGQSDVPNYFRCNEHRHNGRRGHRRSLRSRPAFQNSQARKGTKRLRANQSETGRDKNRDSNVGQPLVRLLRRRSKTMASRSRRIRNPGGPFQPGHPTSRQRNVARYRREAVSGNR